VDQGASAPAFGIVYYQRHYAVCLGDEAVVEGYSEDWIAGDPDAQAHRDARIVRAACLARTGHDPGEPALVDLEVVAWWLHDDLADADAEEAERVLAACEDRLPGAYWAFPEVLAGYAAGGWEGAVAALRESLDLPALVASAPEA
jgi:hypothetical protein